MKIYAEQVKIMSSKNLLIFKVEYLQYCLFFVWDSNDL